ncbi:MAG: hypothetical protein K2O24_05500 [Muribaculaceae bacterium]|nr:hypothetical protein [Muribaculaceae bacterium]
MSCTHDIPDEPDNWLENLMPDYSGNSSDKRYPVDVVLPNRIYAVVGDTLQLFFRGMIASVNPYNYDILVTCERGKKYPRYFEYVPSKEDIGEIPFSVTLRDDEGNIMGYDECVIEVVDKECTENLHIVTFGDSLTSGGVWCQHADSRLPDNVVFCGAKDNRGTHYFGVGGWTWASYTTAARPGLRFFVNDVNLLSIGATYTCDRGYKYTVMEINVTDGAGNVLMMVDNKTCEPGVPSGVLTKTSGGGDSELSFTSYTAECSNPLWDGDKMTFRPYMERYAGGKVDAVYAFMGWNSIQPWQTDFSRMMDEVDKFCRTFHAEYPEGRIYLMGLQLPSLNGGIGNSYGATGDGYADCYGLCITVLNLNREYERFTEERSGYVEFLNVSCQFDSEYNMPYTDKPVNKYNPETEQIGTNGVHPNNYGYYQIGDVVMRSIYAYRTHGASAGVPMLKTR